MTLIWLVVWLLSDTPQLTISPEPNGWAIALAVCIAIDLFD